MYLLGKRVKPKFIFEPFGPNVDLPTPLEESVAISLTQKLRASVITKSERDQLYFGHVRLAIYIAGQYAAQVPRKTQDLIGEALLAIGDALRRAPKALVDDNFTPYCSGKIHQALSVYLRNDHVVLYPECSYMRHKKQFQDQCAICGHPREHFTHNVLNKTDFNEAHSFMAKDSPQKILCITLDEEESYEGRRKIRRHCHRRLEVRSEISVRDLRDLIAKSIKTDEERAVIAYREMGYNDTEIAAKMDRSVTWVNVNRARVERRFEKMEREVK